MNIENPDRHLKKFLKDNEYKYSEQFNQSAPIVQGVVNVTADKQKKPRKTKEQKEQEKLNRSPEEQSKIDLKIQRMIEGKLKKKQALKL